MIVTKHSIPTQTAEDILGLIELMLPVDNNLPSYYILKKTISEFELETVNHTLCKHCHTEILGNQCRSPHCSHNEAILSDRDILSYYTFNVETQLRNIVRDNFSAVMASQNDKSNSFSNFSDGSVHRSNTTTLPRLSLVWHIDYAPVVKSKKLDIYPLTAFVVEVGHKR